MQPCLELFTDKPVSDAGVQISSAGFLGHSQGGQKSLIAADWETPDYIVSLAGMCIETVAQGILRQNREINEANGVKQFTTDQQTRELTEIFEILRISKDRKQAHTLIRKWATNAGVSKDLLVSALENEAPVRSLLHHPYSETYNFEGLNHLFQVAKKGTGPYEYWEIETTIEERVIDKIDIWMKSILNSALQRTSR